MNTGDQSWKVFQRDTEAGRLLSRLYGCAPSKSQVNYPKLRTRRATDGENRGWRTTYTVHSLSKAEEEEKETERKTNTLRAMSMKVPKVGRAGERRTLIDASSLKVDQIPRRKTEAGCKSNVEQVRFLNKKYRPPAAHAFSSDTEKQRLNEIFSHGKGKCLPKDLTSFESHPSNGGVNDTATSKCLLPDSMFDQIYQEVLERREHQMKMERLGAGESTRQTTVNEIQSRLNQLRKIDPQKAEVVIRMLMN